MCVHIEKSKPKRVGNCWATWYVLEADMGQALGVLVLTRTLSTLFQVLEGALKHFLLLSTHKCPGLPQTCPMIPTSSGTTYSSGQNKVPTAE